MASTERPPSPYLYNLPAAEQLHRRRGCCWLGFAQLVALPPSVFVASSSSLERFQCERRRACPKVSPSKTTRDSTWLDIRPRVLQELPSLVVVHRGFNEDGFFLKKSSLHLQPHEARTRLLWIIFRRACGADACRRASPWRDVGGRGRIARPHYNYCIHGYRQAQHPRRRTRG